MKIFLTGTTGFIGSNLLPRLLEKNYEVWALTRTPNKIEIHHPNLHIYQGDLLKIETLQNLPKDLDIAIYLVHSMKDDPSRFDILEKKQAMNFIKSIKKSNIHHIIYVSGLHQAKKLSKHLRSRKKVEEILQNIKIPLTVLRCSIIIGSGSASFEIIRDLTEKIPIMVAPRWISHTCQPVYIEDVFRYLLKCIEDKRYKGKTLEIAGPDILTYREVLYTYAKVRGLKRLIFVLPILTPRLSSLWLQLITSANYSLSRALIDSIKNDSISKTPLSQNLSLPCLNLKDSIRNILQESFPKYGILQIKVQKNIDSYNKSDLFKIMMQFSKNKNWIAMKWLWNLRNWIDRILGGKGAKSWSQCFIDPTNQKIGYSAKMQMPGEAWILFSIYKECFTLQAIFRPKGVLGRVYWWFLYPMHQIVFHKLANKMLKLSRKKRL